MFTTKLTSIALLTQLNQINLTIPIFELQTNCYSHNLQHPFNIYIATQK
jgi:hypothetical protein